MSLRIRLRTLFYAGFQRELIRDTVWTTFSSVMGKSIGLLVPFFIAGWYGASSATDAFFFAYGLILFLSQIFSPVVERVVVPFVAELRSKGEAADDFISRVLGFGALVSVGITLVLIVIIKPLLSVVTRFSSEDLRLVFRIIIESSSLVVLLVWTSIFAGLMNAYQKFVIPAFSPAFRAVVALAFIFVFKDKMNVHAIAYGYVIGEIVRFSVLAVSLHRLGVFHFKVSFRWDRRLLQFLRVSSYQVIGMSILLFIPTINKVIASWFEPGSITLLQYAERLYMIPITLLSSGFLVTLLSYWSKQRYENANVARSAVTRTAIVLGIVAGALTVLFLLLRGPIVRISFGHGKLTTIQMRMVEILLSYYVMGLVPFYLTQVYITVFISAKATKVLLFAAAVIIIATIGLNAALIPLMGVPGIALSQSLVHVFGFMFVGMFYRLWKPS